MGTGMKLTERDKWLMWEAMQQGAYIALLSEESTRDSDLDEWLNDCVADAVTTEMALLKDAPSPWQPIESAPTNTEKPILVYLKNGIMYCGKFRTGTLGEPQPHILAWRCESSGRFSDPTHWMPLPEAPE